MTMLVRAWFGRGERPPASGVSPIRRPSYRIEGRGSRSPVQTDGLTTVVMLLLFAANDGL
jgi:hypothetical protein